MADTPNAAAEKPTPSRPPRRWLRRLGGFLVLLLVLVLLAPNIIGWASLTDTLAQQFLSELNGKVRIGNASLGWFSRIELREVSLVDAEGATVVSVPSVTSTQNLLGLVWDRSNLGEFRIERPTINLVAEEAGTNVERVIAPLMKPSTGPASAPPALTLQVQDATVNLRDAATQQTTTLEKVQVSVTLAPGSGPTLRAAGDVASRIPGKLNLEADLGTGRARLVTEEFPLDCISPFLRRVEPYTTLSGRLTGETTLTWGRENGQSRFSAVGDLRGQDLVVATPALNGDTLRMDRLELPHDLSQVGRRTEVRRAEVRCDVGTLAVRGTLDTGDPLDRMLNRPGLALDAAVDLARLARLLPHTLTVREGTTVQEGKVVVKLASLEQAPGTLWKGELRTSALRAERQGRPLRWDDPLLLTFTSRMRPGELPSFDQFECRSDFLTATASGSAESLQLRASLSLDRLVQKLADFVDLGGVSLAGRGEIEVKATRSSTGSLQTRAVVQTQQFDYTDQAGRTIREPNLTATLDLSGQLVTGQPVRIETGTLAISAGTDLLSVNLRAPIADLFQPDRLAAHLSLTGDLARWRTRADGLVGGIPKTLQIAGSGTITGLVAHVPNREIRLERLGVDLDRAAFRGYGILLDEPKLMASASAVVVQPNTSRVEVTNLTLSSSTVALSSPQVTLEPIAGAYQVVAQGTLQADLARLQRTLQLQTDPRGGDAWAGRAGGTFRCTADGTMTQFGADLDVQNFAYGPPQAPQWKEPQLKLNAAGVVDPGREKVRLETCRLSRDALTVDARGSLSRWSTTNEVALSGSLTYDLAKLTPQFRDFLGAGFQASGQGRREFTVTGSLSSLRTINSSVSLGWQSVRAYGLDVGPGELRLNLANGVLTSNPVEASFLGGSGRVRVQPTVRLDPAPQEATLANGTLIDRARLTPAATAQALGYALPAIANSSNTEGEFSFHLESNRIPLAAPTQTSLRGRLVIHRAIVSAGPLTSEIARLLRANQTSVVLANENVVPVRVENGRVHHENLTLTVNNFTLKTRGSVGLDGTLSLVAEVPAPAGLLNNSNPKIAQVLAGRTIPVPISGTLQRPMLDAVAFQQGVARMAAEAVQDTVIDTGRELINKELNKVLPVPEKDRGLPKLPGLEKLIPGFPRR